MPQGFLRFDHPRDYLDHRPETPAQEAMDLLGRIAPFPVVPRAATPITDWLRVTDAIRCGTRVSLEAELPGRKVSIHFHDVPPFHGAYKITDLLQHRDEHGWVAEVEAIEGNRLVDHRHAMLAQFSLRYIVTTTAEDRSGTQRIWRIGVSEIRDVTNDSL
jgi:hypothetical protein